MLIQRSIIVALALLSLLQAQGQTTSTTSANITLPVTSPAVEASTDSSKLRQMELIYQQQLRSRHIPLLGKYLTELQKLSPAPGTVAATAYRAEMERVQAIISAGGVMDLTAAVNAIASPGDTPMPRPMPPPAPRGRTLISLTPALSKAITPTPASGSAPDTALIGEIEWRLETMPLGEYEVVMQYACPQAAEGLPIQMDFAGEKISLTLAADQATPSSTTFRLLRLGQLSLKREVRGDILHFRAGDGRTVPPVFTLRQLIISKAKPRPSNP